MNMQQEPREASPRAIEGALALSPSSRGRSTAPHLLLVWLPILVKVAAAAGAAVVLAVIGAKAGAHRPPSATEPVASAAPPVLAAALVAGGPAPPTTEGPTPAAVDAGTAVPSPVPAQPAEPAPGGGLLPDGRVVLNDATETDLTKLPGIGPSRAHAILALRQRLKRFRAVEDLLRVKGIGRKMLRRLRPSVVLDRPSVDTQATPASTAPASPRAEDSDATER
jgi:competence protein ComEA